MNLATVGSIHSADRTVADPDLFRRFKVFDFLSTVVTCSHYSQASYNIFIIQSSSRVACKSSVLRLYFMLLFAFGLSNAAYWDGSASNACRIDEHFCRDLLARPR